MISRASRFQASGDNRGQLFWMAECGEVTAGHDDGVDAEPLAGDALLELEREEPVVAASHDMDRDGWPGGKRADVVELLVQLLRRD